MSACVVLISRNDIEHGAVDAASISWIGAWIHDVANPLSLVLLLALATASFAQGGGNVTFLVPVTSQSGKAFKKGTAIGQAFIDGCTFNFCRSEHDQETISLTN